jgi:HSP20 family protein
MFLIPNGRRTPRVALAPVNRLDRMFDEVFSGFPAFAAGDRALMAATDISESENAVTLTIELPGVRSEDVNVSLENDTLTIKAEKKQDSGDNGDNADQVHRVERSFGTFERRFNVSKGIDVDGIEASQTDGVLTVVLPKSERAKSRDIEVK